MISQKEREIWQACDDLLAMGKKPREITGEALGNRLRELGYKAGSLTYRFKYRDSWMVARGLSREDETVTSKPSDVIERSAALFRQSIEEDVRKEYEEKYQHAAAEITALTENFTQAQQQIDIYQVQQAKDQQTIHTLEHDLQKANADLTELHKELAVIHIQTVEREGYYQKEQRSHANEIAGLKEQQAITLQEINQHNQAREAQYKENISNLLDINEKQRHEFIYHHDQLKTENTKLLQALAKSEEREVLLKSQLKEKLELIDGFQQLQSQLRDKEQQIAALTADNQRLEQFLKEAQRDAHQVQLGRLKATAEAAHFQTELNLLKKMAVNQQEEPPDEV